MSGVLALALERMALSRGTVPSTVPVGQPLASGTNGTPGTPGTVGTSGATTVALLENGDAGKKANEDVAAHVTVLSRQSKSEPRAWRAPPRRAPTAIDRSTTNQTSPFCTRARPPTTARAWRHSRARRSILSATSICRRASLSDAGGDGGSGGGSVLCVVLTARQARRIKSIRSGGRGKPCARHAAVLALRFG